MTIVGAVRGDATCWTLGCDAIEPGDQVEAVALDFIFPLCSFSCYMFELNTITIHGFRHCLLHTPD